MINNEKCYEISKNNFNENYIYLLYKFFNDKQFKYIYKNGEVHEEDIILNILFRNDTDPVKDIYKDKHIFSYSFFGREEDIYQLILTKICSYVDEYLLVYIAGIGAINISGDKREFKEIFLKIPKNKIFSSFGESFMHKVKQFKMFLFPDSEKIAVKINNANTVMNNYQLYIGDSDFISFINNLKSKSEKESNLESFIKNKISENNNLTKFIETYFRKIYFPYSIPEEGNMCIALHLPQDATEMSDIKWGIGRFSYPLQEFQDDTYNEWEDYRGETFKYYNDIDESNYYSSKPNYFIENGSDIFYQILLDLFELKNLDL